jgi:hypothetical protein
VKLDPGQLTTLLIAVASSLLDVLNYFGLLHVDGAGRNLLLLALTAVAALGFYLFGVFRHQVGMQSRAIRNAALLSTRPPL